MCIPNTNSFTGSKTGGTVEKFKTRLVAKGYSQIPGLDFDETYTPVIKLTSICILLALALKEGLLHIHQMDVETAFLNGPLQEEIYIRLPDGVEGAGQIKQLRRAIYGLKQSPHVWNKLLDKELRMHQYERCHADYCIYIFCNGKTTIYLAVYVDDMIMLGNCAKTMNEHKVKLGHCFKLKDLGDAHFILGLEIIRSQNGRTLMLSQCRYIDDMAKRFGLVDAKPSSTPLVPSVKLSKDDCLQTPQEKADMEKVPYQSLIGSLMYAMLGTRPDIAYAVGALSKFAANPG